MKAHQRKQGIDGRFVGLFIFNKQVGQAHGFQAKVFPQHGVLAFGIISFAEEQVQSGEHRFQPFTNGGFRREVERYFFQPQLFFGPEKPFVDGFFIG